MPSVHPRAGGEHRYTSPAHVRNSGSSPRRRGTLLAIIRFHSPAGFIPAPAGNTRLRRRPCQQATVHPRAGREHAGAGDCLPPAPGSSPRRRDPGYQSVLPSQCGSSRAAGPFQLGLRSLMRIGFGGAMIRFGDRLRHARRISIRPHPYAFVAPNPRATLDRNISTSPTVNTPLKSIVENRIQ